MAMVMDFLIGILLLLAAAINVLALGAFGITPSLRSTSNRFVINLLIVNVIGCLILAPSLLFNSNVIRNLYSEEEPPTNDNPLGDTHFNKSSPGDDQTTTVVVKGREINSTMYKVDNQLNLMDGNHSRELINDAVQSDEALENTDTPFHSIRPWILDIVTAIGSLSLVLVVGDTYCAVTDPLRYHSRLSSSRVCCLLIIIWAIAVGFGLGSALRSGCIDDILLQHSLYNTVFGSAYFICIILIPFSLVGAMYWGIIREARKNGLRLRHNGSSPLLQSVLHIGPSHPLHHHHHHHHHGQCLSRAEEQPTKDEEKFQNHQLFGRLPSNPATKSIDKTIGNTPTRQTLRIETNLRRNKSAQHLMGPTCCACGCCEEILITRSISNQSAYLNSGARHLKVSNRDLLRTARSSPDLHQNLLLSEGGDGVVFEHIRMPISVRPPKTSLGYMTSIRHRLSNASSMFKYREESRAARISILVVIMFLVSYIPFGLLVVAEGHDSFLSTYQQTVLAIFFVVLANIISPLIFAYRNKRVRRGIQRLVSVPGRTGCGRKDRGKGENINNNNNGSIREASERNTHQTNHPNKMNEHTRDKADDTYSPGQPVAGSPLFNETNGVEQRRKLVIFNGRNGQITKICHPEHHKNFVRLKECGMMKGCSNNDQLVVHNKSVCTGRNKNPFDIGCSESTLKLTAANQRVKVIKSAPSEFRATSDEGGVREPFLRRFRSTSGQLFKKSTVRAMVPPPQVNIDFPSTIKPMNV